MQVVEKQTKNIQIVFVISLIPVLLGSLILALAWVDYRAFLFILIGYTFAGHYLIRYLSQRGKNNEWFISLAVIHLFILTPEVFLRLNEFYYTTGIQFGYPKTFEEFVPDEELFWTLPPNQPQVNSWGFLGNEVEIPKPAEACRILFLGDSVSMQGFPNEVKRVLNERQLPVEIVNLSVAGYSTYQGRVVVDKYGSVVAPDIVVVVYGWNDHWLAYDSIDSQKKIEFGLSQRAFSYVYNNLRILQGLRYLVTPVLGQDIPLPVVRVPLNEYVDNLTYIGEFFTARDVPVVFITPPTSHYALGVPAFLIEQNFAVDKESVIRLHKQYNQALRELIEAKGWYLLDLEQAYETSSDLDRIFTKDGIHLTDYGQNVIGKDVANFISDKSCW